MLGMGLVLSVGDGDGFEENKYFCTRYMPKVWLTKCFQQKEGEYPQTQLDSYFHWQERLRVTQGFWFQWHPTRYLYSKCQGPYPSQSKS